jgi:hypothetical protein
MARFIGGSIIIVCALTTVIVGCGLMFGDKAGGGVVGAAFCVSGVTAFLSFLRGDL